MPKYATYIFHSLIPFPLYSVVPISNDSFKKVQIMDLRITWKWERKRSGCFINQQKLSNMSFGTILSSWNKFNECSKSVYLFHKTIWRKFKSHLMFHVMIHIRGCHSTNFETKWTQQVLSVFMGWSKVSFYIRKYWWSKLANLEIEKV